MTDEDDRKNLLEAMLKVSKDLLYVKKDGVNQALNYTFVSAANIAQKVSESCIRHGIATEVSIDINQYSLTEIKGKLRTDMVVTATVGFSRGTSTVKSTGIGSAMDYGDKAAMKANTAALKYALTNAFIIGTGDDPEADSVGDGLEEAATQSVGKSKVPEDTLSSLKKALLSTTSIKELDGLKPRLIALAESGKGIEPLIKIAKKRKETLLSEVSDK
jgi:hypothetical protein